MNINLTKTKINHSDMDEGMKKSILLILDKAIGDADIVAKLEERIKELEESEPMTPKMLACQGVILYELKKLRDEELTI